MRRVAALVLLCLVGGVCAGCASDPTLIAPWMPKDMMLQSAAEGFTPASRTTMPPDGNPAPGPVTR